MNDECVIPDYQKPKILYAEFEESTFLQRELWRCACLWEESQTGGLPLSPSGAGGPVGALVEDRDA